MKKIIMYLKENLAIFILIAILLISLFAIFGNMTQSKADPTLTKIENVFVDINGDGYLDYVKYAEVIVNPGENSFPVPEATP